MYLPIALALLLATLAPALAGGARTLPEELDRIAADCREEGRAAAFEPGLVTVRDLDGDGRPDILLDTQHARCAGERRAASCGTGGCMLRVFLRREEGYVHVFRQVARSHAIEEAPDGGTVLTIESGPPAYTARFSIRGGCVTAVEGSARRDCAP